MGSSNTTTSPLLPLFKEQLDSECATLAKKYELKEHGHSLNYWYFMRLFDFTDTEVEGVFCDGGGDLGIDSIWIDDEGIVHFYNFKHFLDLAKVTPAGDIDKMISGIQLILFKKHSSIANPELKARIEEIYQQVAKGYQIHLVSSGQGIPHESVVKMDALVDELRGGSDDWISWEEPSLAKLQELFYQQNLPAIKDPITFELPGQPYMLKSGSGECYLFHATGEFLAKLYDTHGEGLLQRNIRVDQGDTATNRSIEAACIGDDSSNFLHFNNGVTFLCEEAKYDPFKRTLTLQKAQVVNGGQTIRALHRALKKGSLKQDVFVPARAVASSGDKDFANNVSVNQNNQNSVGTAFLRSNDPRVVQLDHALAAKGWYLERREGELKSSTPEEKTAIEKRIGRALVGRVIRLKEGAQAYTATFYGQPEIAKKNPKKIFFSIGDGGNYEKIFSADMTAEKLIIAHEVQTCVEDFVRKSIALRRKAQASEDVKAVYQPVLGEKLAQHYDVIHQVIPQCSLFVCGTIYYDIVDLQKKDPSELPKILSSQGSQIIQSHLLHIIEFAKGNKEKADKSWPVLLKSNTFFGYVKAHLSGIHKAGGSQAISEPAHASTQKGVQ